jgi:di/tricarboxylate transporter
MKLVDDARRAWRWFSVQALAVLAVVPLIWGELPPEVTALIPAGWHPYILAGVAVAGIMGRLVDQGKP